MFVRPTVARQVFFALLLALPAALAPAPTGRRPAAAAGTHLQLALLETTDLHSNVLSYNYSS
jgi:2',3'-cyclic-nucleotide 2'-phosphodiesterase/3'-nucleotidase